MSAIDDLTNEAIHAIHAQADAHREASLDALRVEAVAALDAASWAIRQAVEISGVYAFAGRSADPGDPDP